MPITATAASALSSMPAKMMTSCTQGTHQVERGVVAGVSGRLCAMRVPRRMHVHRATHIRAECGEVNACYEARRWSRWPHATQLKPMAEVDNGMEVWATGDQPQHTATPPPRYSPQTPTIRSTP